MKKVVFDVIQSETNIVEPHNTPPMIIDDIDKLANYPDQDYTSENLRSQPSNQDKFYDDKQSVETIESR